MHRSGTTMLAKLLHLNGINMGPLRDSNYESRLYAWDVLNFQNFLLGTWDNPFEMLRDESSDNYQIAKHRFINQIKMRARFHKTINFNRRIGWKHPVASLLLPELSEIPEAKFISIRRNDSSVIKSLQKRKIDSKPKWFPGRFSAGMLVNQKKYAERLNSYYKKTLDLEKDKISLELDYDKIMDPKHRRAQIEKLATELGLSELLIPKAFFDHKINAS